MMKYSHIAARVLNTPLLIDERKLQAILGVLGPRLGFDSASAIAINGDVVNVARLRAEDDLPEDVPADPQDPPGDDNWSPFYRLRNGVATIPIIGSLANRVSGFEAFSGVQSYASMRSSITEAVADDRVKGILLDIDSPGGEVAGVFDLSDLIFASRGVKPIVASVNDMACSAAYLIASACDKIVTTQTGQVGSIGVVWTHVDVSKMNQAMGIAVTHVYAGKRKIEGSPYMPLSGAALARFQADVDQVFRMFVGSVARNRSMSEEAVIATQADVFIGSMGVEQGLADEIGTFDSAFDSLTTSSPLVRIAMGAGRSASALDAPLENDMAGTTPAVAESASDLALRHSAELDRLRADHVGALARARDEGRVEGRAAERTRCKAILGDAEAAGREAQAQALAFDTDLPPEQAVAVLKTGAKAEAKPAAPANVLAAAMGKVPNPSIGPDAGPAGGEEDDDKKAMSMVDNVLTMHRNASVRKV